MSYKRVSAAKCQLAYTWLIHQQVECTQNTRNIHEAVKHQYMCIFSRTWTCVVDANNYSYRPLYLDHFCGFINSNYAAQNKVTWNVYVKPNIHVYFRNFSLWSNFCSCDFEYLQVITSNINSTFCGTRFPWVHDATDSSVKIIFLTKRFGSQKYLLQFQYYGVYIPNYQHFVLFTESSAVSGMHVPNVNENEFETFHFISSNRLDILYLAVVNACSTHAASGLLRWTWDQVTNTAMLALGMSSTFQMVLYANFQDLITLTAPKPQVYAIMQ